MCSCPSPSSLAVLSRFLSAGGKKALQKRSSRARAGCGSRSARRSSSGARPARSLRRWRLVQRPAHSGASQRGGGEGLVAANGRPRPTRGQARTSRPDRSSQPSQHKARGPGAEGRAKQHWWQAEPALGPSTKQVEALHRQPVSLSRWLSSPKRSCTRPNSTESSTRKRA